MVGLLITLAVLTVVVPLLWRIIHYPSGDTFSLLELSVSTRKMRYRDQQFVVYWDSDRPDPTGNRFGLQQKAPYTIFSAILSAVPFAWRMRWGQLFNILLLVGTLFGLYWVITEWLLASGLDQGVAQMVAGLVATIYGLRARLVTIAMMGLSDILSHALLVSVLYGLTQWIATGEGVWPYLLGVLMGIAIRNRTQDLILVMTVVLVLFLYSIELSSILLSLLMVLLVNIDSQIHLLRETTLRSHLNAFAMQTNEQENPSADNQTLLQRLLSIFSDTVKRFLGCGINVFSLYSVESLWRPLGLNYLLFPLSCLYLISGQGFNMVSSFVLIFTLLLLASTAMLRHRVFLRAGESVHCMFGGRQMLVLYPLMLILHALAVAHMVQQQNDLLLALYTLAAVVVILHQIYRYLDYHFSDHILESKLFDFPAALPSWSRELGEFVANKRGGMVILGSYLIFGEVHNTFHLSPDLRFVDCYSPIEPEKLAEMIDQYRVTHLVQTPISCYGSKIYDSAGQVVSEVLRDRLTALEDVSSPNLRIYQTNYAVG